MSLINLALPLELPFSKLVCRDLFLSVSKMLPNTFVLFFAPAVLAAVVPGAQSQPKVTPFSKFPPSYFKGLDLSTLLMTGTKNDSSGIPVQQILPPVVFQQAIHKKIRYGPYKLPSTKVPRSYFAAINDLITDGLLES